MAGFDPRIWHLDKSFLRGGDCYVLTIGNHVPHREAFQVLFLDGQPMGIGGGLVGGPAVLLRRGWAVNARKTARILENNYGIESRIIKPSDFAERLSLVYETVRGEIVQRYESETEEFITIARPKPGREEA